MASIGSFIFYVFIFLSVYVQVFMLVTFFENKKKIITRKNELKLGDYPAVTIMVPCWNEENTVSRTVNSLLNLNYPQNKLNIFLINDGSTDNTLNVLNTFKNYSNIRIFNKENGGKYTALNLGLENVQTDFLGCLDADSVAHPEALARIMTYFQEDMNAMAVAPSVTVYNPKNIIQNAQSAEYHMGVYMKKMLCFLGAINVTPGPLTVFRKKVFDNLGPYRHGHNTEDMEIAYRMQKNRYKIVHCNDAYVYTNTPKTIKKLYKQRLRWIYGFINNTLDYKSVLFKKEYGNFALFTLPTGIISIFSVSYLFGKIVYNVGDFIYTRFIHFQIAGLNLSGGLAFDPFFINTKMSMFMVIFMYFVIIFAIVFGRKMSEGKMKFSLKMLYFFPIFALIAPFWIMGAILNTAFARTPSWR